MTSSKDPTRIDLENIDDFLNPLERRMKGHANHGWTPFDVPYISHLDGNLWQGGCEEGLILPSNITKVLSLYPWEKYTIPEERKWVVDRVEVEMYDSTDQGYEQVDSLARAVNNWLDKGEVVLVHCQAGLNRSSLVAARALMFQGKTADEAINLIREARSPACLCNPAFEGWLRDNG